MINNITCAKRACVNFLNIFRSLILWYVITIFGMELSGIELRYLINEIRNRVIDASSGYYVSSINAITKNSLFLRLHHPLQEDVMLVLSTRGLWITRLKFKPVEEDNSLENISQKELERAKLESMEQVGSERIALLKFRHVDGKIRIVVGEFFGDGNLIICNEGMQIIALLNPIRVRHRTLSVGLRYAYPPARGVDVFNITLEQMLALRDGARNIDVLRWIGRNVSMPKKFVEEVVNRAGIKVDKNAGELSNDEVFKIYSTVKEIVNDVSMSSNKHEPIVVMINDKPQEALPIITQEVAAAAAKMANNNRIKKVASYMDAVDEVLSSEIMDIGRNSRTVELDRQIAVLEHDLEEQNKAKETVLQKATVIRKLAHELMMLSYHGSEGISDVLAANSASFVTEKGITYIEVAGEQVKMQQSLAKASSMLFERAKEMERGNASIEEARNRLLTQIEKLRSETASIHKRVIIKEQVSREWYERYRWFITTDGLLVIGGRDASSNSALIRKHLTEHDIVFHAEVHGSPFFIIKNAAASLTTTKEDSIDSSLHQVAQATISFSRAWKDGLSSADAYWVLPQQVKRGAPTGQFLPKGSFVIEGKRNYLKGVELRLAIGIMYLNNRETLVCGPEESIKKYSIFYGVLLQGGMDPMNAAKKVKSEFVKVAFENIRLAESIKHMSLDEFVRVLPTGQSRLSFTAKGQQQMLQEAILTPSVATEVGDKQ
jgi:predicted ribosome quality control (RQC) complex YloA/Tae2 family protein